MTAVCLYFQVHQPPRLRRYSVFDAARDYFDDARNRAILRKIAHKCYTPAADLLLDLIDRHDGAFCVAFSLTGCVIEQLRDYAPETLERFQALAETGRVEFLSETYHHSLACLYSPAEFRQQIELHRDLIDETFSQHPRVFRNTELIYNNALADTIDAMDHYAGALAEGVDGVLDGRSPNYVYAAPHDGLPLLLKHHRLSDDIAFRFSDPQWDGYPLTADTFADWIHRSAGECCNLFMDFETFGEHQWAETGIFEFLAALPDAVLGRGDEFLTPTEIIDAFQPRDAYDVSQITSWADTERDASAWIGNAMQSSALEQLYQLETPVKRANDPQLLQDWRNLTCSDHFYYMCTKYFADGQVHKYFNPYESPYDSYINYMNVLDHLRERVEAAPEGS